MERYVNPLPPPGTHPEAFLAAVLTERRDREFLALQKPGTGMPSRRRSCTGSRTASRTRSTDDAQYR